MSDSNWRFDCCWKKEKVNEVKAEMMKPLQCTCGYHVLLSTGLMGMYNDEVRNRRMMKGLERMAESLQRPSSGKE